MNLYFLSSLLFLSRQSITIPGISYVVDTGRQKCRNYDSGTGVASFDIVWISQAAADQRAGRAGRTGPGHCYRLYSSSMYSRQMEPFAQPEVLTRPLEDVVLAMKAMRISNVSSFPFCTPPDGKQLDGAVRMLADLACLDMSNREQNEGDGEITKLGAAVAQLPLGVRYGKMVLVAAQAGVLDYILAVVSALSENSPFLKSASRLDDREKDDTGSVSENDEERKSDEESKKPNQKGFWIHQGGDVLATVLAIGAYTHAGRNAGGAAQRLACRKFCESHGLNSVIMGRIHEMRLRLTRLLSNRLGEGLQVKKDDIYALKPPNKLKERLLTQAIASCLLDNVATLAPVATFSDEYPMNLRSAYLGATADSREPLFLERNSVLYSHDTRQLPQWVCFDALVRKTHRKTGQTYVVMKGVTAIDPSWLGYLAKGSRLLSLGAPLSSPMPQFSVDQDSMLCSVTTKFGRHSWDISPIRIPWQQAFSSFATNRVLSSNDVYAWFGRCLLEGKVFPELDALRGMLVQDASVLTNTKIRPKAVQSFLASIQSNNLTSRKDLLAKWRERGARFLWSSIQPLVRPERVSEAERLWIKTARQYMSAA